MGKGRRGRPRAERARYPSGQAKPEGAGITGTALQRLRALGTNPILESQVGRLLFLGELELEQAQTAWRIAEIYGRYDRAMGRRRSAASPSYEIGHGLVRRGNGREESEDDAERKTTAVRRFGNLQAEIRLCPRGVKPAIEELCIEDRACPAGWLPQVKIALSILAEALGLRRRGQRSGND